MESYVKENVIVPRIIIATLALAVGNALQDPLDWIAAEPVQRNITDSFVKRNVTVHRVNIATLKGAVWNVTVQVTSIAIQRTAVFKRKKVNIRHAYLI